MILHPWHSISPGIRVPECVNCIIEIPQGSRAKYELDKESGLLRLDRVLYGSSTYPMHYGFVPQTYGDDDDPLDMLVICSEPLLPLSIVETRVIDALDMIDGGQQDYKLVGVACNDRNMPAIATRDQIDPAVMGQIVTFFTTYKTGESKTVDVRGFLGLEAAHTIISEGIQAYNKRFKEEPVFPKKCCKT